MRRRVIAAMILAGALVAAGCGGKEEETAPALPENTGAGKRNRTVCHKASGNH